MLTMIAFLLIFFMLIHAGTGNNDQCSSSSMNDDTNIIIDRYVPLGQHFNFSCDAYERIKQKYLQIISVQWLYRCQKDSFILDNNPNSRFVYDQNEYFLIGYDIQSIHEGILECHVLYKNSLTNVSNLESSTINLKVQDCNEKIDSNASHALRNPCQFGQCQVVSAKLGGIKHEKLYCDCFDQYTGLYCDVEKFGTWWRELLYYSSTFGHFICTGIIFLSFYCFDRSNSKERISLIEDVPEFGRIRDQTDMLYPAARKRKQPTEQQPQQQQQPPGQDPLQEIQPQDPTATAALQVENPVVNVSQNTVNVNPLDLQEQPTQNSQSNQQPPQNDLVLPGVNGIPQQHITAAAPTTSINPPPATDEQQPQQNPTAVSPSAERVRQAYLTLT